MALGLCVGVAATKRRSDVAASAAHTYTPIHMNMSYLSIILFCISDAVFRFAFFFGQLLCFFLGDFTQTHAHMHICSVSAACAAAHSLSTLSSLSQALLLLLPDVSLSLLLRFVLSHLLSCSLTDLSLSLVCQAAVVVAALPACSCCCSFSFCSACCSFSGCCCCCFAAFHGCCLSYSEGAN